HKSNAVAGSTVYIESFYIPQTLVTAGINPVFNARLRLIDPYGNVLSSTALVVDTGGLTLPATGTYTLLAEGDIRDPGTGSYVLKVHDQRLVDVVSSDPSVAFKNQTGAVAGLGTATFDGEFRGDGQGDGFDLRFISPDSGLVLGSIPVTINEKYLYKVKAIDPDGDALTYSLTTAPAGMAIDPSTGLISW